MRASELWRLHFGRGPELFFDGLTGRGQSGSGGAANEKSLDNGPGFHFRR